MGKMEDLLAQYKANEEKQKKKKTEEPRTEAASSASSSTKQATSSASTNSKMSELLAQYSQNEKARAQTTSSSTPFEPSSFYSFGGKYVKNADGGYSKVTDNWRVSEKDLESRRRTGHDTLGTDLGQAIKGGLDTWKANQLSTLGTIDNIAGAIREKNNFYQPETNSQVWRQNQATSANSRAANALTADSKEGRGKIGTLAMDVASQAVMNGIDAAIKSIPYVGQALGTISFASRAFGGSVQQARDEG